MSRGLIYAKALAVGGLIVGFGYMLMRLSTPTEEQYYAARINSFYLNKLSPEHKKRISDKTKIREHNAAILEMIKKVAESDKPSA
ncbi:12303_t:CDS:2 [Acaulospora morrowiae]|uniref:12303_t:CDS:1 n=1 Tax=Acaulospora morrowiae TaxID=94023 RepID=A0A9N8V912_9GLOM|nr:12303_t:CDS:2 [Acaulospora morrowiae]